MLSSIVVPLVSFRYKQENRVDELMMNLFSLIAGQVQNRQELFEEEGRIMGNLLNVGYRLHEADAAITLMQTLVQKQVENFFGTDRMRHPLGLRTMNSEERRRFAPDAFAFALKLTHLGVLSQDQREGLLEKAMNLPVGRVELEHIKTLVAFLLFTGSSEQEDAESSGHPRVKDTAWN